MKVPYCWMGYAYSFLRNMNEEQQKTFIKALLYCHDDVDVNWHLYKIVMDGIKADILAAAHQCGQYLGDKADQMECFYP